MQNLAWRIPSRDELLDSYAKLDEDDLRNGVGDLVSSCRWMMNGDDRWRTVRCVQK